LKNERGLPSPRRSASYGHNWRAMLAEWNDCPLSTCWALMSKDGKITALAALALLLLGLSLGGCATSTAGSSLMDARAEAPALPKTSVYLPVEDLPPKSEKPAMTADERSKLKKELIAARDRQAARRQPTKP
jgi:hypothetical protein